MFSRCKYTCLESQRAAEVCRQLVTAPFPSPTSRAHWGGAGRGTRAAPGAASCGGSRVQRRFFLCCASSARMGTLRCRGNSSEGWRGCLGGLAAGVSPTCTLFAPAVHPACTPCPRHSILLCPRAVGMAGSWHLSPPSEKGCWGQWGNGFWGPSARSWHVPGGEGWVGSAQTSGEQCSVGTPLASHTDVGLIPYVSGGARCSLGDTPGAGWVALQGDSGPQGDAGPVREGGSPP